ncbi:RNA methyltransferase [candidate division KSB1 bacterium]
MCKLKKLEFEDVKSRTLSNDELKSKKRNPVYFICENIRSLYNVGSIFRTSDALRVKKIFLTGFTGFPPRKEISKVALGAEESVPWEQCNDTGEVITKLKKQGIKVIALEHTNKSKLFQEYDFQFPVAIVLGHEYEGIKQDTLELCDDSVEIDMYGIKQSLNVATSVGVIGYELLSQLKLKGQKEK